MLIKALTTFFHSLEGMWLQGDSKEVSDFRAQELIKVKLVQEVKPNVPTPQSKPEVTKEAQEPKKRTKKVLNPVEETK